VLEASARVVVPGAELAAAADDAADAACCGGFKSTTPLSSVSESLSLPLSSVYLPRKLTETEKRFCFRAGEATHSLPLSSSLLTAT
jgi:hypothetical protein